MREILFRGKRIDNGEWVYGSLIRMDDGGHQTFIFPPYNKASSLSCGQLVAWGMIAVIPETIGQDTGLKDKNGKKIFEGDILLEKDAGVWETFTKADGSEWSKFAGKREDKKYTVFFDEKTAQFTTEGCWLWPLVKLVKVIGNVHDKKKNPTF